MAEKEICPKRKHSTVSAKSHPMKIRKTATAETRLQHATETGIIAAVTSILETESKGRISQSVLNSCLILAAERGHRRILQLLLKSGADINTKNDSGCTPLMIASEKGFLDIVRSLIKRGADVKNKNLAGKTAFLLGVEHSCSSALLNYFLSAEANVDVNDQDQNGKTALMLSVEHWDIDAMETLIRNRSTNLDLKEQHGNTAIQLAQQCGLGDLFTLIIECYRTSKQNQRPLKLAVKRANCDIVRLMLDCDYTKINEPDYSPLMAAFVPSNAKEVEKTPVNLEIVKMLINSGADVNKKSGGWTTLMYAAKAGSVEGIGLLLENGADVNQKGSFDQKTALMVASEYGHTKVVEFLIKGKADVALKDRWGSTALKYALEKCKTECARVLLNSGAQADESLFRLAVKHGQHRLFSHVDENLACKELLNELYIDAINVNMHDLVAYLVDNGADVNKTTKSGMPPLYLAVTKNKDMVELLISKGAGLNDQDKCTGYSALMKAASLNQKEMVRTLVAKGADVTLKSDKNGFTALKEAVKNKSLATIKILLEAGAEVNDQGVLHVAVEHGENYKIIRLLLHYGADVNSLNSQGETPIMRCKTTNTMQLLLNKGADVNAESVYGNSLLQNSINCNNIETVKWLIKTGVDINKQNCCDITPLVKAVTSCSKSAAMVKLLVENGANVNQPEGRRSPLHQCLIPHYGEAGSADVLKVLIDNGADVNVPNSMGETPLMVVADLGRCDMMQSLLDAGANVNAFTCRLEPDCVLSKTLKHCPHYSARFRCLEMVLENGAKMNEACLSDSVMLRFHILITFNEKHLVHSLIKNGVTPGLTRTKRLKYYGHFDYSFYGYNLRYISPFCTALFCGHLDIAKLFLENWFLVESDLYLCNNSNVLHFLDDNRRSESLAFLRDLASEPRPLAMKSFLVASQAIGFTCGREERIRALPIPNAIKERLLYKV